MVESAGEGGEREAKAEEGEERKWEERPKDIQAPLKKEI